MKKAANGFTLVETLVVIAVIVMLSAIAYPLYTSLGQQLALNSQSRQLLEDLRLAQQLAVSEQITFKVVLNPANNSYLLQAASATSPYKSQALTAPARFGTISGLASNTVSFNLIGAPSGYGTINLLNANGQQKTIEIKPSGYVDIKN